MHVPSIVGTGDVQGRSRDSSHAARISTRASHSVPRWGGLTQTGALTRAVESAKPE